MDDWKNSMKHHYHKKKNYSQLNKEDITDRVTCTQKKFEKKIKKLNLGEYHDLYVQSDILLLGHVFENLWNTCPETCELDSTRFLTGKD